MNDSAELFGFPGMDTFGMDPSMVTGKLKQCLHQALDNMADQVDDNVCPKTCLKCIKNPSGCVMHCYSNVCGCGGVVPQVVDEMKSVCCDLAGPGADQCRTGLERAKNKAVKTVQYNCGGGPQDSGDDGSCQRNTGGSCAWMSCHASRHAECDTTTYDCYCPEGTCARGGVCTPALVTAAGEEAIERVGSARLLAAGVGFIMGAVFTALVVRKFEASRIRGADASALLA